MAEIWSNEGCMHDVLMFLDDEGRSRLCVASRAVATLHMPWARLYAAKTYCSSSSSSPPSSLFSSSSSSRAKASTEATTRSPRTTRSHTNPRTAYFREVKLHLLMIIKLRNLFLKKNKEWTIKSLRALCASVNFPLRADTVVRRYRSFLHESIYSMAVNGCRFRTVRMLLENFPSVNVNTPVGGDLPALGIAAWAGDRATVAALLRDPRVEPSLAMSGRPPKTSSCLGKGPYTAAQWCLRKMWAYRADYQDRLNKRNALSHGCDTIFEWHGVAQEDARLAGLQEKAFVRWRDYQYIHRALAKAGGAGCLGDDQVATLLREFTADFLEGALGDQLKDITASDVVRSGRLSPPNAWDQNL